jgi:hypothetical protein
VEVDIGVGGREPPGAPGIYEVGHAAFVYGCVGLGLVRRGGRAMKVDQYKKDVTLRERGVKGRELLGSEGTFV